MLPLSIFEELKAKYCCNEGYTSGEALVSI